MSKIFDNKMHWGWKVSFVVSLLWLLVYGAEEGMRYGEIDGEGAFLAVLPTAIWVTLRWILIGKEDVTD